MMSVPLQELQVRPARLEDIDALLALENSCFSTDKIKPRQMRYLLSKAKACTYVACYDGQLIAYAMVFTPQLPRPARLYSIAVAQAWRGKRVAERLLQNVLGYIDGLGYCRVRLEVRISHTQVQALYQRFGFIATGEKAAYYEDNEDALLMERCQQGLS